MRKQSLKTPGLVHSSQWKTLVLFPNKFLTRTRTYYTQRIAGSMPDIGIVLPIKCEDGRLL